MALVALALCCSVSSAMGWANGPATGGRDGYGFGTHDWLLEHAIDLAGNPDWLDVDVALYHSNDPDYFKTNSDWHLFRDSGKSRGGPQAAADYYYAAVKALKDGDTETASEDLGVMSHYYADMLVPFHTTYDALQHPAEHLDYELEVDSYHRHYSDSEDWIVPTAPLKMTDVRARAIKAAYFSRSKYLTLRDTYSQGNVRSNSKVNKITRDLLSRAVNDMADIIRSMPSGSGVSPPPAKVKTTITKHYPGRGRKICACATCLDDKGQPLQGIRVEFCWPKSSGGTTKATAYSDTSGVAHYWYTVPSDLPLMKKYTVKTTSTSGGASVASSTWFITTPPLAAGALGIKTTVSDHSPRQGTVVGVSTVVRDANGRPVVGLPCTFTWSFRTGTVSITTTTGSSSIARISRNIGRAAKGYRVYVRAQVISDSTHRSSTSSFVPR